jgi:hypothetical protein
MENHKTSIKLPMPQQHLKKHLSDKAAVLATIQYPSWMDILNHTHLPQQRTSDTLMKM